jgi:caa(3)-type oxidase subunit IV
MSHHDSHAHDHEGHGAHHITPAIVYHLIFGALLCLTVITVWIAQFDFGAANTIIAMLVATVKASLVALFFMHLLHDDRLNMVTFGFGLLFVALFFLFPLLDITSRTYVDPLKDNDSVRKAAKLQELQDAHAKKYEDKLSQLPRLNQTGFITAPKGEGDAPAQAPAPVEAPAPAP